LLRACRNKLVQITYALANVYDDSPELDLLVTDEHRTRAQDMMACVESGDVTRLREAFLEVCVCRTGLAGRRYRSVMCAVNSGSGRTARVNLCVCLKLDSAACAD
jgi:hypothetical protein